MKNSILALGLFLFVMQSCGTQMKDSGSVYNQNEVAIVDFCNLENYNGKLIKTNIIYSGVEEYFSAKGLENCPLNDKINLNFEEFYNNDNENRIEKKLLNLGNNYATKEAIMTVVGVFRLDSTKGFGHLNTYPAEILVKSAEISIRKK